MDAWTARDGQHALFGSSVRRGELPRLSACAALTVGIDVGGVRKGFHAVALQGGAIVATFRHTSHAAVVEWCRSLAPEVVAVDAPCRWSAARSRSAERELHAQGIHIYPTPTLDVATRKPFFHWMLNGADLYLGLESHYVLFDGAARDQPFCFETFPHAIACALAARLLRGADKRADRRSLLSRAGVDLTRLTNIDLVDAALCAVTAAYVRTGCFHAFGKTGEGLILVPAGPVLQSGAV